MSTHPGATRLITAVMFGFAGLAMIVTGCSSTSKVAQNAKGSVFLEEIMDWSFEASHPAVIDQTTLLKIVKGIYRGGSERIYKNVRRWQQADESIQR